MILATPSDRSNQAVIPACINMSSRKDPKDHWSDISLSGSGFVLCPAKHHSVVPNPDLPSQDQSHPVHRLDNKPDGNGILVSGQNALQDIVFLDAPHDASFGQPIVTRYGIQANVTDPSLTALSARESSAADTRMPEGSASIPLQDGVSSEPVSIESDRCSCRSAVRGELDGLPVQQIVDIGATATDALLLSAENGLHKLSSSVNCTVCSSTQADSLVIVTAINQLALMLSELVHRQTHCQSASNAPTVFQFGAYRVQSPKMRTSLLTSIIALHVKSLEQLISRLESCMAEQARLLLEGAKNMAAKMQQTLQSFNGGSSTV